MMPLNVTGLAICLSSMSLSSLMMWIREAMAAKAGNIYPGMAQVRRGEPRSSCIKSLHIISTRGKREAVLCTCELFHPFNQYTALPPSLVLSFACMTHSLLVQRYYALSLHFHFLTHNLSFLFLPNLSLSHFLPTDSFVTFSFNNKVHSLPVHNLFVSSAFFFL